MGAFARRWVDFLREAKQAYWQILPLNPPDPAGSPYQSVSSFAGAAFYIDLDGLCADGLLDPAECSGIFWGDDEGRVDFEAAEAGREVLLRKAFGRFDDAGAIDAFISRNSWVESYSLYMVIKAMQGGRPWNEWDLTLRERGSGEVARIREEFAEETRYHAFTQLVFNRQWRGLRAYANENGVEIIGDVPFYVSLDSADAWSDPGMFLLGGDGLPREVAGYPPDALSDYGQLWGNPLYRWDAMAEDGFIWRINQLRYSFELYDVVRLDHFRGFELYYAIPGGGVPADGAWRAGPGRRFIDAVASAMPDARFIAEDLGEQNDAVDALLEYSGFPGMKVLQFAFDPCDGEENRPYKYPGNTVVYTGTHDNDTARGWAESAPQRVAEHAMEYMGVRDAGGLPEGLIREAMRSAALLAVVPIQDWLGLGNEARINTPSTVGGGNWSWRMGADAMSGALAGRMAGMSETYDRATRSAEREVASG